ncbi:tetratricopeptide repeat protein [Streptomyces asiaticus]
MKFPGCATAAGDLTAACDALNVRGVVAIYQQRYDDAEAHLREALRGFRADDNLACVAGVLSNLSRVHAATGRADSAVDLATRGVDSGGAWAAPGASPMAGSPWESLRTGQDDTPRR